MTEPPPPLDCGSWNEDFFLPQSGWGWTASEARAEITPIRDVALAPFELLKVGLLLVFLNTPPSDEWFKLLSYNTGCCGHSPFLLMWEKAKL